MVGGMRVSAMLQEQFQHLAIPVLGGGMKRGPAFLLTRIGLGTVFQQKANYGGAVGGGGAMQRRDFHGIARGSGGVSAGIEQQPCDLFLTEKTGKMECREAIG